MANLRSYGKASLVSSILLGSMISGYAQPEPLYSHAQQERALELVARGSQAGRDYLTPIAMQEKQIPSSAAYNRSTFEKSTDFTLATFRSTAWFELSTFNGPALFRNTEFLENAQFVWSSFHNTVDFSHAHFTQLADFYGVRFHQGGDFFSSQFMGKADFSTVFSMKNRKMDFSYVIFQKAADFHKAKFLDTVDFDQAKFKKGVDFSNTQFHGFANFENTNFSGDVNFQGASFGGAVEFNNAMMPEYLNLENLKLNATLDLSFVYSSKSAHLTRLNILGADINKLRLRYDQFTLYFPEGTRYAQAVNVYEQLLDNFKEQGFMESYKQLAIELRDYKYAHTGNYIINFLDRHWWNYGFDKYRVLFWWLAIFLFYALINSIFYKEITKNIKFAFVNRNLQYYISNYGRFSRAFLIFPQACVITMLFMLTFSINYRIHYNDTKHPLTVAYLASIVVTGTVFIAFIFSYVLVVSL